MPWPRNRLHRGGLLLLCLALLLCAGGVQGAAAELVIGDTDTGSDSLGPPEPVPMQGIEALRRQLASGEFEAAESLVRGQLRASRDSFGNEHPQSLAALVNLGVALHHSSRFGEAAAVYRQAVDAIEAVGGSRDPRLVPPLHGLAALARRAGAADQAVPFLQRAAFITRTDQGLNSIEQLRYIDPLLETYALLGEREAAAARQQARLSIVAAASGAGSEDHLEALRSAARFYRRIGDYEAERRIHEQRRDLLVDAHGRTHPALLPVLEALAATYRLSGNPDILGLQALQDANRIAERSDEVSAIERAELRVALGDHYQAFGVWGSANAQYRRAYRQLSEAGELEALEQLLGRPHPVQLAAVDPDAPGEGGLGPAEALFRLDINARGGVRRVERLSVEPPAAAATAREVETALGRARFRPRISDKGAQATKGLHLRYHFRYPLPADGSDSGR